MYINIIVHACLWDKLSFISKEKKPIVLLTPHHYEYTLISKQHFKASCIHNNCGQKSEASCHVIQARRSSPYSKSFSLHWLLGRELSTPGRALLVKACLHLLQYLGGVAHHQLDGSCTSTVVKRHTHTRMHARKHSQYQTMVSQLSLKLF